jgi:hypothetical protein
MVMARVAGAMPTVAEAMAMVSPNRGRPSNSGGGGSIEPEQIMDGPDWVGADRSGPSWRSWWATGRKLLGSKAFGLLG